MTSITGLTQDGRESKHALSNTGPRRFLVVEFDGGGFDQQAAILLHLAQYAPFVLVLDSGRRSLHGWFFCKETDDQSQLKFMRYAVSLGADKAMWTRSQFVRMPDALRDNGNWQRVIYFNPELIKKNEQ